MTVNANFVVIESLVEAAAVRRRHRRVRRRGGRHGRRRALRPQGRGVRRAAGQHVADRPAVITPIDFDDLRPDLQDALRARYERLGYLGDFFRFMAHQPAALIAFDAFTEACKHGPAVRAGRDDLAHRSHAPGQRLRAPPARAAGGAQRAVALLGGGRRARSTRVAARRRRKPTCSATSSPRSTPTAIRPPVLDAITAPPRRSPPPAAVALLTARFIGHATVSRACRLQPTVPSIFDPAPMCSRSPIWSPPERHGWIPVVTRSPRATDPPAFRSPPERDRAVPAVAG